MRGFLASLTLIIGCSGAGRFKPSEVVERIAGKEETPAWANGERVMWSQGNDVFFVNTIDMDGSSRPSVCMRAAALDAKVKMLEYVKQNISSSGELAHYDLSSDPAFHSLSVFIAQGSISGSKIDEQYWEKVAVWNATGENELKLRCAARLVIAKNALSKQLYEATVGKSDLSAKINKAHEEFINSLVDERKDNETKGEPSVE